MYFWSCEYLSCVRCKNTLHLDVLNEKEEIIEGFLRCKNCKISYPIISKVPILWDDFSSYLTNRPSLGGLLLSQSKSSLMKKFVRDSLTRVRKKAEDITILDKRWVDIYLKNKNSSFYSKIKQLLNGIPKKNMVLEHGCSVGFITKFLAKKNDLVFGIDSSYLSVLEAKKNKQNNMDFFVADSVSNPFGEQKFGLVVALNLLEVIEPEELLKSVSRQIKDGTLVISDPYDYERGKSSVKKPLYEKQLREKLVDLGFQIIPSTKKPSYLTWKITINPRTTLNYKVDIVLAKKL